MKAGPLKDQYALILGASSGFGAACAVELSHAGMHIYGIHLDRKQTMPNVERVKAEIEALGRKAVFYNVNAADPEKREAVLDEVAAVAPGSGVRVLVHSLAFGSVGPLIDCKYSLMGRDFKSRPIRGGGDCVDQRGLEMTLDVMANSLIYWARGCFERGLLGFGGRIFAMTSAGDSRVWRSYGAVSAAKAAIESHIRQLAVELAPAGITANALRAGVTETPALRKIPENAVMIEKALSRNPSGRLTTPKDVADAVVLLADPRSQWITGNVIGVDGGEFITD